MTAMRPYILEGTASVDARLLIFADSIQDAAEILQERTEEMMQSITETANLPEGEHILWYFDVRPASGHEVAGSDAIQPGLVVVDKCEHEDHEHLGDEGGMAA